MTPRKFAIGLMIAAGALFFGTALANVVIDPVAVFGTNLFPHRHPNYRYLGFRHYQRDRKSVDALMFASSRGFSIDQTLLAKRLGAVNLLSQPVPYGLITDHLPFLEYVLKDKAARGEKIKSVMLMVDIDLIGKPPWTNVNIDCFLPPELTGGSHARFWWRYLTAVQLSTWRDGIKGAIAREQNPNPTAMKFSFVNDHMLRLASGSQWSSLSDARVLNVQLAGFPAPSLSDAARFLFGKPHFDPVAVNITKSLSDVGVTDERFRRLWITKRPDLERQFAMIEAFVRLCREYGVKLTIAATPLQRSNIDLYAPGELDAIGERLNRITEFWDFATGPLSDRTGVWIDYAHFTPEVGTMMITRMFGGDVPVPDGFGRLRPQTVR